MSIFVTFMGVRWDVGLMDSEFLSSVNLINGVMRQAFRRISWPLERFVIEVILP